MRTERISSAVQAPPIIAQANRIRRRIAASDAVAALLAELAYGPARGDLVALVSVTAERVGSSCVGSR